MLNAIFTTNSCAFFALSRIASYANVDRIARNKQTSRLKAEFNYQYAQKCSEIIWHSFSHKDPWSTWRRRLMKASQNCHKREIDELKTILYHVIPRIHRRINWLPVILDFQFQPNNCLMEILESWSESICLLFRLLSPKLYFPLARVEWSLREIRRQNHNILHDNASLIKFYWESSEFIEVFAELFSRLSFSLKHFSGQLFFTFNLSFVITNYIC